MKKLNLSEDDEMSEKILSETLKPNLGVIPQEEIKNNKVYDGDIENYVKVQRLNKTMTQEQSSLFGNLKNNEIITNDNGNPLRDFFMENDVFSSKYKVIYKFSTDISRKKENKAFIRNKNKIFTRVHNTDSMLKKIKSKYLKYIILCLRERISLYEIKKFEQLKEVRNLKIQHNRDEFISLTILEFSRNNQIISNQNIEELLKNASEDVLELFHKKIKYHYLFEFLTSNFFRNWIKDPMRIKNKEKCEQRMTKSEKFPKYSKNIFLRNKESYDSYIKMLHQTSHNFIFYFQNNPLKYGKKFKSSE